MFSTISQDLHHTSDPNDSEFSRIERNVRINVYHGIADSISLNLASPFIGIFAIKIGASNFQVGLLSSGPALVSLLSMIPGARYLDKRSNQKQILSRLILFHRLFLPVDFVYTLLYRRQTSVNTGNISCPDEHAGVNIQRWVAGVHIQGYPCLEACRCFRTEKQTY